MSELRNRLGSQKEHLKSRDRGNVRLDLSGAEVDLIAFDAAIASRQLTALEQAATLYQGPLLEGCTEEWYCKSAMRASRVAWRHYSDWEKPLSLVFLSTEGLAASRETEWMRARHRDWFLALAEGAKLAEAHAETPLQQLATERDNLRAALAWCWTEEQGAEPGLRLPGALWRFWWARGEYSEGRRFLEEALKREWAQASTPARAKALRGAGVLAMSQGDYVAAQALLEESLSIRRELEDRQGIAVTLGYLGDVALEEGDYVSARTQNEESLSLCRELGDRQGVARALNNLDSVAHGEHNHASARTLFHESLNLYQESGDRRGIAYAYNNLAELAYDQGEVAKARTFYEESLNIRRVLGEQRGIGESLVGLAMVLLAQSDGQKAVRLWGVAHKLRKALGLPLQLKKRKAYQQQRGQARSMLGDDAFTAIWRPGFILGRGSRLRRYTVDHVVIC